MLVLHNYARRIQNYASNCARLFFYAGRFHLIFTTLARQNTAQSYSMLVRAHRRSAAAAAVSVIPDFSMYLWCMVTWPPTRRA